LKMSAQELDGNGVHEVSCESVVHEMDGRDLKREIMDLNETSETA
jgi:hypothetical protein